jgi:hypothetical protein
LNFRVGKDNDGASRGLKGHKSFKINVFNGKKPKFFGSYRDLEGKAVDLVKGKCPQGVSIEEELSYPKKSDLV